MTPRFQVLAVAALSAVSFGCQPVDPADLPPAIRLIVHSPQAGEKRAVVTATLELEGPVAEGQFLIAQASKPETVFRSVLCQRKCTETIELPTGAYELWGKLVARDEEETTLLTERHPNAINSNPIVAIGVPRSASELFVPFTGENVLDQATVIPGSVRVVKRYQAKPFSSFRSERDIGMAEKEVPVEVVAEAQSIRITGDFGAPATYRVSFPGVRNQYGKAPADLSVSRPFFQTKTLLGTDASSGQVHLQPRLVRSDSGDLFLLEGNQVSKFVDKDWALLATWQLDYPAISSVDPAGTPYLAENGLSGATVRRWSGTEWTALPEVAFPQTLGVGYRTHDSSLQFEANGTPVLCVTLDYQPTDGSTAAKRSEVWRWSGSAWSKAVETNTLAKVVRTAQGVVVATQNSLALLNGNALQPIPLPAESTIGFSLSQLVFSLNDVLFNDRGETFLLFTKSGTGTHGLGVLKLSGGQWSLIGNDAATGYLATGWPSPEQIEGNDILAWTLDAAGEPVIFSRERVYLGASDGQSVHRLILSGYRLVAGKWAPLAGAESPVLEGEEPSGFWDALGTASAPMSPVSARYGAGGTLWLVKNVAKVNRTGTEWHLAWGVRPFNAD